MVIILLLCTKQQGKLAPTSPPAAVPLPPPLPPSMPPKFVRGKSLPPRPSSEPAWLQEIHGNSLFLSKQRDSCGADVGEQEGGREEGEDEEEGLLVIENDGGENLDEATFPPGVV